MLAFMCTEPARNRGGGTARMKGREYRELAPNERVFLHRVEDSRKRLPRGERAEYDRNHWRVVKGMTLFAGRWQITVRASILGTVPGVREQYITVDGLQVAGEIVTQSTTVVLACEAKPEEIVLEYVEEDGQRRGATDDDLAKQRRIVAEQQAQAVAEQQANAGRRR